VLRHFGIAARPSGDEYRLRICPACGPRSRDCVCIHRVTGHWFDHAHGCKGDVLGLVAGLANLDCATQFSAVLELAAQIAGVEAASPTPARSLSSDPFATSASLADDSTAPGPAAPPDDVARRASAVWSRLAAISDAGARYLERRGLAAISTQPDLVRQSPLTFDPITPWGRRAARLLNQPAICVPVRALDDGSIVNVVARRLAVRSEDQPKVISLPGIKKVLNGRLIGTFGSWPTFHEQPRDLVLVEGVFDYLTAVQAWPDKLVLGADGAALLAKTAAAVASAARAADVRVLLVPHNDNAGYDHGYKACATLVRAGVRTERIRLVDVGHHKDLNDALVAGEVPVVE
jgi:hypothetical protein